MRTAITTVFLLGPLVAATVLVHLAPIAKPNSRLGVFSTAASVTLALVLVVLLRNYEYPAAHSLTGTTLSNALRPYILMVGTGFMFVAAAYCSSYFLGRW